MWTLSPFVFVTSTTTAALTIFLSGAVRTATVFPVGFGLTPLFAHALAITFLLGAVRARLTRGFVTL